MEAVTVACLAMDAPENYPLIVPLLTYCIYSSSLYVLVGDFFGAALTIDSRLSLEL